MIICCSILRTCRSSSRVSRHLQTVLYRNMSDKPRLQLAVDFDGTLTVSDTLSALASISCAPEAQSVWKSLTRKYMDSLEQHLSSASIVPARERRTLNAELQYLQTLKDVEKNSYESVCASGIFENLSSKDIQTGAEKALENGDVQMRSGWGELIQFVTKEMGVASVMVISVNFSAEWIRGVLIAGADREENKELRAYLNQILRTMPINANEILNVRSSGDDSQASIISEAPIHTAHDKLQVFKDSSTASKDWLKIYIGDSLTDLECLISADIGICVRNTDKDGSEIPSSSQRELDQTCERIGITIERLIPMSDNDVDRCLTRKSQNKKLWWAADFKEVLEWLKRITYIPPEDWLKPRWDAYHSER